MTATARTFPSLVLSAYAEDLIVGARVAVFGDVTLGLSDDLADRGARLVHAYDFDAARVAEANTRSRRRSVVFAELPESGDLGVRDGAFDFVLVPDLSLASDPGALLALAKRILSAQGGALIASPNPECEAPFTSGPRPTAPLGYYELYDIVAASFPKVRMIGQTPFAGYSVAEFSIEGEPELSVDTSLAGGDTKEPEWFLALASERDVRLDPFAIIELPLAALRPPASPAPAVAREAARGSLEVEQMAEASVLAAAKARALAESERAHALEALETSERGLADALENVRNLERKIAVEQARAKEQADQLQKSAQALSAREAEGREGARALAQEKSERSKAELDSERLRAEGALLRANPEPVALRQRIDELESALAKATAEREEEFARWEAQLRERGHEVAAQHAELVRRERLVKDLVSTLEDEREAALETQLPEQETPAPAQAPTPLPPGEPPQSGELGELREHLDRLAKEAARREADLIAASWRIAQLERQLSSARHQDAGAGPEIEAERAQELETALKNAHAERDALRRALAERVLAEKKAGGPG